MTEDQGTPPAQLDVDKLRRFMTRPPRRVVQADWLRAGLRGARVVFPLIGAIMAMATAIFAVLADRAWGLLGALIVAGVGGSAIGGVYLFLAQFWFAPTYRALEKRTAWTLRELREMLATMRAQRDHVDRVVEETERFRTEATQKLDRLSRERDEME